MSQKFTDLSKLREEISNHTVTRRDVLKRATALGLSAPVVAGLLAACGGDDDDESTATSGEGSGSEATATSGADEPTETAALDEPTATLAPDEPTVTSAPDEPTTTADSSANRGGGGRLNLLNWQAASIINPHLSQGGKDDDASRICMEPLAEFDTDGNLVPFLAKEIPSLENGDVASDGTSVTWRLRDDVFWQDGEPFTAEDVRFTWEYTANPDTPSTSKGAYAVVEDVEIVDEFTVKIVFTDPTPAWFVPFTDIAGMILPEHILKDWTGEDANDAPFNQSPIGTGPFIVSDFRPQDVVIYDINMNYWQPGKPYFDSIELKGGGDATSAARAVLETGDVDFAVNLQVEVEVLDAMEATGIATVGANFSSWLERILINQSDPNVEIDGERSSVLAPHPALSELAFRKALFFLVDRDTIAEQLYGKAGQATANILTGPPRFSSPNTSYEFNIETAAQMLDDAGWVLEDGVRTKGDYSVSFLFQSSTNSVRQKNQEIVKQSFEEVGLPVELKAIDSGVFFSSDPGNPDTYRHFYADLEMYTGSGTFYPIIYMSRFVSLDPEINIAQQVNEWSGENQVRWFGTPEAEQYNELWEQANTELDPEIQNELFIEMNDIAIDQALEIPEVFRGTTYGVSNQIVNREPSAWANWYWDIANWTREG